VICTEEFQLIGCGSFVGDSNSNRQSSGLSFPVGQPEGDGHRSLSKDELRGKGVALAKDSGTDIALVGGVLLFGDPEDAGTVKLRGKGALSGVATLGLLFSSRSCPVEELAGVGRDISSLIAAIQDCCWSREQQLSNSPPTCRQKGRSISVVCTGGCSSIVPLRGGSLLKSAKGSRK